MNHFRLRPWYVAAKKTTRYSLTVDTQYGPADYVDINNNIIMFDSVGEARYHVMNTQERGKFSVLF